ncbi:hypothetical protein SmJEL517_g03969 [Synchytrium microbalum]|uniref:Enoyl-CoA hydratase n=1 Tax=Synchytrium microbalum TaxID=1806994 RepID=A0A507C0Q1_9FUNG|nr:uncharacterized protein SmJEL517_g03969 [Synchytrium microbalum]TPX32991.1 hypothetical protein SmJEL517_g03969 [Synchytrium microbalum]
MSQVKTTKDGPVFIITINRPEVRNAVDRITAALLVKAFRAFEADDSAKVAILYGNNGNFCAGADLKAVLERPQDGPQMNASLENWELQGPMGPSRMRLAKPVLAAIEGFAVAGGIELAAWCDMRICAEDATLGVFCRLRGVPLVDGGTVRLPRLIGRSNALDLILTGRPVQGAEALRMGLANRIVPKGTALAESIKLAKEMASHPQVCLLNDRKSVYEQLEDRKAMEVEFELGQKTLASGEFRQAVGAFLSKKTTNPWGAGKRGAESKL